MLGRTRIMTKIIMWSNITNFSSNIYCNVSFSYILVRIMEWQTVSMFDYTCFLVFSVHQENFETLCGAVAEKCRYGERNTIASVKTVDICAVIEANLVDSIAMLLKPQTQIKYDCKYMLYIVLT